MTSCEIRDLSALHRLRRFVSRRSRRRVVNLAPEASAEWIYDEDGARHRSGGFFRIMGLRYRDPTHPDQTLCQPIIDQPEVGVLSMVVCEPGVAAQVLVQLKCEPGNVGAVQLAPTCQATQSNLTRVHGGSLPPGARLLQLEAKVISDSLQSEQGTRFWRKRNRNLVMAVASDNILPPDDEPHLRWIPMSLLRQALAVDYLVNTDARSVLATMDWEQVMGQQPFAAAWSSDVLERILRESWRSQSADEASERAAAVMHWLERHRLPAAGESSLVALAAIPGLRRSPYGFSWGTNSDSFNVRHMSVSIIGREREGWDQPLIDSRGLGEAWLVAFQRQGAWQFIFRAVWEPGLHDRIELHPSLCRAPGAAAAADSVWLLRLACAGNVLRQVRQSEEGGRFWRDVTVYRIVTIADPGPLPDGFVVLSLREIALLTPGPAFTNEARSAISLLLSRQ